MYRYELLVLSRMNVLDDAVTDDIRGYMMNFKTYSAPSVNFEVRSL